jgi:hypothetical protein
VRTHREPGSLHVWIRTLESGVVDDVMEEIVDVWSCSRCGTCISVDAGSTFHEPPWTDGCDTMLVRNVQES